MGESRKHLSISELSSLSGTPESTINYYIRNGLLPKPVKKGKTRQFSTSVYITRLKLIKKFREENLSLNKIKEIINLVEIEKSENPVINRTPDDIREKIIGDAINLFLEKGYEKTTIADFVNSANIGRSTFYRHFKNKKELFVACMKNIFIEIITEGDKQVTDKNDILMIFEKRTLTYVEVYRKWGGMMNLLKAAAISDPTEFSDTLEEGFMLFINETNKLLQTGIEQGMFREVNTELLSVMLIGGLELSCYYYLHIAKNPDIGALVTQAMDMLFLGLERRP